MNMALPGLFASSFLASTLLPGGSEVALVISRQATEYHWLTLLSVATTGNALGSLTSWFVGRLIPQKHNPSPRLRGALTSLRRHGAPVLLFAWLPIVGDPLCVAAGWLRIHWILAGVYITIGKAARYGLILALV